MYAIVDVKDKQFKVRAGDRLYVPRHADAEPDATLTLDRVLLASDGDGTVHVGTPTVEGASVTARVLGEVKGDKVIVFKKKRRKRYTVKRGHRQRYTQIQIEALTVGGTTYDAPVRTDAAPPAAAEEAEATAAEPMPAPEAEAAPLMAEPAPMEEAAPTEEAEAPEAPEAADTPEALDLGATETSDEAATDEAASDEAVSDEVADAEPIEFDLGTTDTDEAEADEAPEASDEAASDEGVRRGRIRRRRDEGGVDRFFLRASLARPDPPASNPTRTLWLTKKAWARPRTVGTRTPSISA